MKAIAFAFAVLLGAASAASVSVQDAPVEVPREDRFVGDLVAAALEEVSQQIREAGLDPWTFDQAGLAYELPVPVLLSINALLENIEFKGASNIVINHINYGLLSQRLTLDISLPEISLSIGDAALDVVILGSDVNFHVNGRLSIIEPRVSGEVVLNIIGIIGGSVIRDINLEFDLGGLQYNGAVNVLGYDLSNYVSTFVGHNIPNAIAEHKNEINELIEIVVADVIASILP